MRSFVPSPLPFQSLPSFLPSFSPSGLGALSLNVRASTAFSLIAAAAAALAVAREDGAQATYSKQEAFHTTGLG